MSRSANELCPFQCHLASPHVGPCDHARPLHLGPRSLVVISCSSSGRHCLTAGQTACHARTVAVAASCACSSVLAWQRLRAGPATMARLQGRFSPGLEQATFLGEPGHRVDFGPWHGWKCNPLFFSEISLNLFKVQKFIADSILVQTS
jgi:hypothetical protein